MENLLLTPDEQRLVLKLKNIIQRRYNVSIHIPDYVSPCDHDVVVATVYGGKIDLVKNFIQKRLDQMKQRREQRITVENNVTTITLSDSDSSLSPNPMEMQPKRKKRQKRRPKKKSAASKESGDSVVLSSTILLEDSGESADDDNVQNQSKDESSPLTDYIPIISEKENTVNFNEIDGKNNSSTKTKPESPNPSPGYISVENAQLNGNFNEHNPVDDTIELSDSPLSPDFISLHSEEKEENIPNGIDDCDIIIEDEIPRPIVSGPKSLRPVVIDGSNVAREHGRVTNTFSCKGIKIAIDYFLQRGHTQVTAFVPHYRRHNRFGPILTTDQPLLEELSKAQHVVFTPSRRINNKRVTCYDDRFIVELAAKTGGVILSNDNYRDLVDENEEFKRTINERLLMFCFVGDIIMIPQDPLGRNGPSLENFLSFPA
ncbi:NEDD4-binding protein 1-like isoform X1 [Argiope bruennichi]|uniref:NEDD4-binding protein 1-like isoform X1 n=1 Tax=Argiope bruennichi TaxID=94029 RepID=UPI002494235F|nr:NEDD4-binding protein 1-like isoform X1 [Argiope bruennichi]